MPRILQAGDFLVPVNFDPELPPSSEINRRAAQARGVVWDPKKRAYVTIEARAPMYDPKGNPLANRRIDGLN